MLPAIKLANPSAVKQAPNAMALNKPTVRFVESMKLETPPSAQIYLEPGVNTKLTHRSKPKTNYELPSDMPKYPLGFVPVNQTPGASGEEPPMIKVRESVPADLLDVFAKINVQQQLESEAVERAKLEGRMDIGTELSKQYTQALNERAIEAKVNSLLTRGFTEDETIQAMRVVRAEDAVKAAREPTRPQPVKIALEEIFVPEGKTVVIRKERGTAAEVQRARAIAMEEKEMEEEQKKKEEKEKAIGKGMDIRQRIIAAMKQKEEK